MSIHTCHQYFEKESCPTGDGRGISGREEIGIERISNGEGGGGISVFVRRRKEEGGEGREGGWVCDIYLELQGMNKSVEHTTKTKYKWFKYTDP